MRQIALITFSLLFLNTYAQKTVVLTVKNPTTENFKGVVIGITDQEKLAQIIKLGTVFEVNARNKSLPFQLVKHPQRNELLFQIDLKGAETVQLRISKTNKVE